MITERIERTALLIGSLFSSAHPIVTKLQEMGLDVRVAAADIAAFGEMQRMQPGLIVVDAEAFEPGFVSLCQRIRRSEDHVSVPLVVYFDSVPNGARAFLALEAGADDCFTSREPVEHFQAKVEWLMLRRRSATLLRQYHYELKHRHEQTLDLVRATTNLMESIDAEFRAKGCSEDPICAELMDAKLDMGLDIVRSLASILEQQNELYYGPELLSNCADFAALEPRFEAVTEMGLAV